MNRPSRTDSPGPPHRARRWAMATITIQFLVLLRNLGQVYWMELRYPMGIPLAAVTTHINDVTISAVCCWISVTLYFFGKYIAATAVALSTVALLIAYRVFMS